MNKTQTTTTKTATPGQELVTISEPFRVQAMRVISFIGLLAAALGSADFTGIIHILPPEASKWLITLGLLAASTKQLVLWLGDILDNGKQDGSYKLGLFLLVFATLGCLLLPSCMPGVSVTSDGCILGTYTKDGQTYLAGPCVGEKPAPGTGSEVDRFRVEWQNPEGQHLRATYWLKRSKSVLVEYKLDSGVWLAWSAKSGVMIGPVPPEVQSAMEGAPPSIPAPNIIELPEA